MSWQAEAPSNIALIKYMGKLSHSKNQASNASLSYTLTHLKTKVVLELSQEDSWQALDDGEYKGLELSLKGQQRFLDHLKFLKTKFNLQENFKVSSGNNFPSDCGLASSASSFAALTQAVGVAASDIHNTKTFSTKELANLSRQGSGSSCRSFFAPWALWTDEGVSAVDLPWSELLHEVILIESSKKEVSSSEAHKRVASSLLFSDREERVKQRLGSLLSELQNKDWAKAFKTCWAEFWDMHALFLTSSPPFSYMQPGSIKVLNQILEYWQREGDGPLVTMDAGSNIHLLYRPEQKDLALKLSQQWAEFNSMRSF